MGIFFFLSSTTSPPVRQRFPFTIVNNFRQLPLQFVSQPTPISISVCQRSDQFLSTSVHDRQQLPSAFWSTSALSDSVLVNFRHHLPAIRPSISLRIRQRSGHDLSQRSNTTGSISASVRQPTRTDFRQRSGQLPPTFASDQSQLQGISVVIRQRFDQSVGWPRQRCLSVGIPVITRSQSPPHSLPRRA